jgi:uncharacterized protein (TIGR01777 family)
VRVLVTGGTGFIGRFLCRRLLADGHAVDILSRQPANVAGLFGHRVTTHEFPVRPTVIDGVDAIINLAGAPIFGPRWSAARKRLLFESRVGLTEQLVQGIALAKKKPTVLLSGSAIGFYGDHGDQPLDESASPTDDFAHQLCDAWELAACRASDYGVRVCTLRTGLVLGPGGGLLQRMSGPFKLGLGGRLGDGRQWMSWIHIEDHIDAMMRLLTEPALRGPFNLTAPHPVPNRVFTQTLAAAVHRPALFHLPAWLLRFLFGEMASLMLCSQRVLPKRLTEQADLRFRFPVLDSALADCLKSNSDRPGLAKHGG